MMKHCVCCFTTIFLRSIVDMKCTGMFTEQINSILNPNLKIHCLSDRGLCSQVTMKCYLIVRDL